MPHLRAEQHIYLVLLMVSGASIAAMHAYWPGLRFEYGPLNYSAFAFAHMSLPVLLALLAFSGVRRSARTVLLALTLVVALPTVTLASIAIVQAAAVVRTGSDTSLELVSELVRDGNYYRLYRTGANPAKAHSFILRRETQLFIGVKRVTEMKGFYGASDASLVAMSNGLGRVSTKPYNKYHAVQVFEFRL